MPALSIVASSAAGESCFTEELIRQISDDGELLIPGRNRFAYGCLRPFAFQRIFPIRDNLSFSCHDLNTNVAPRFLWVVPNRTCAQQIGFVYIEEQCQLRFAGSTGTKPLETLAFRPLDIVLQEKLSEAELRSGCPFSNPIETEVPAQTNPNSVATLSPLFWACRSMPWVAIGTGIS